MCTSLPRQVRRLCILVGKVYNAWAPLLLIVPERRIDATKHYTQVRNCLKGVIKELCTVHTAC